MSARAARRAAVRTIVAKAPVSEVDALALALRRAETLEGFTRDYKTRLERMVLGLNMIQRMLIKSDYAAASKTIRALFASDLKEARETVANREQALDIAVVALEALGADKRAAEALGKIAMLAPESASAGAA